MDKTVKKIFQSNEKINYNNDGNNLGKKLLQLRKKLNITQIELAKISGLSHSTLSKIENNQLSPTFETILKITDGIKIDISDFISKKIEINEKKTRRVITKKNEGLKYENRNYLYETLCDEIANKKFIPILTRIKSHSIESFGNLLDHPGEEFLYVIEGEVMVYNEYYKPIKLLVGDSMYFDSSMGHALISTSDNDALVIWISTPN